MQTLHRDETGMHIDAAPDDVYDLIADVTRMPSLSPEVRSCRWLDGAAGPAVGARFEAVNGSHRGPTWKNRPVIVTADRGREFAFARSERFAGTLVWRYRFAPDGDGTLVTESYEVTRPVSRLGWLVIAHLYGGRDRQADLREGMTRTLERLRDIA